MVLFHVLGPVEARAPGGVVVDQRARKPHAVLATLLLHANAWVGLDRLVASTWPEQDTPTSAGANVKTYIWQLRRALPDPPGGRRIESRPGAYLLRVEPGELDVDRAGRLAAEARRALLGGDHRAAAERCAEALALWRGELFDGAADDVAPGLAARVAELRWELREVLADALAGLDRPGEAIDVLRSLTEEDPLREEPWARWVRVLGAVGRPGAAAAVYERARTVLARELGVEPGPRLRAAGAAAARADRPARRTRRDLPRDVPDFACRAGEVERISAMGRAGGAGAPVVVVIDGMPGVGKTALATRVAHRLAPAYPDAQLHLDLGGDLDPAEVLARGLRALEVPAARVPDGIAERAALWRAELARHRVLLVLDGAADAAGVRPLLPGGPGAMALVTSRSRLPALEGVHVVALEPLGAEDGATALRAMLADRGAGADPDAVAEVVRLCGGLPSAMRAAAGRFLSRPMWTLSDLVGVLSDEAGSAAEPAGPLAELAAHCATAGQAARRVLGGLPALPGGVDAAGAAVAAGMAAPAVAAALEELLDRHLVVQPAPGRYAAHPLVRKAVRSSTPRSIGPRVA